MIVESAVHFMAESISILAHDDQRFILPIQNQVVRWKCWQKILW